MRTRKEVEQEKDRSLGFNSQPVAHQLIIELLLDIRDLLTTDKQQEKK
jgi:hypothetical protein